MELLNFHKETMQNITKLASISLCPNVIGQVFYLLLYFSFFFVCFPKVQLLVQLFDYF